MNLILILTGKGFDRTEVYHENKLHIIDFNTKITPFILHEIYTMITS